MELPRYLPVVASKVAALDDDERQKTHRCYTVSHLLLQMPWSLQDSNRRAKDRQLHASQMGKVPEPLPTIHFGLVRFTSVRRFTWNIF
jgi:hypothetical protein